MEVNKKRLKEIQDLREEYVLLDDMFKIPQADPEETVTEPTIETTNARINGHRQNIATIYQNIVSSFQDEVDNFNNKFFFTYIVFSNQG